MIDASRELALGHLAVQAQTVRVIRALQNAGIDCVLLKGVGHELWLYGDGARPVSRDVDVLIPPSQFDLACETISELGMRANRGQRRSGRPVPELRFVPSDRNGVPVEPHRSFHFVHAPAKRCWELLSTDSEQIELGGTPIDVPSVPARAALLALHAAYHRDAGKWVIEDLRRALAVVSLDDWRRAARLSDELRASAAFSSGLRLLRPGAAIADALGLVRSDDPELLLYGQSATEPSIRMVHYAGQPPLTGFSRLLGAELIPPADRMRTWYPLARRGRGGLALAYAARLARLGLTSPLLIANWRQARGAARHIAR